LIDKTLKTLHTSHINDDILIKFAIDTLNILQSDKEWSGDTTDEISLAAMQCGLAGPGKDGMFEILLDLA